MALSLFDFLAGIIAAYRRQAKRKYFEENLLLDWLDF